MFLAGHNRIPSGQDSSILPARVANHSARFGSSCALAGRIINLIINPINNALWLPFYYSVIVTSDSYWLHQLKTGFNANSNSVFSLELKTQTHKFSSIKLILKACYVYIPVSTTVAMIIF